MNLTQRIVLIFGAIILIVIGASMESYQEHEWTSVRIWYWQGALVRGLLWSGAVTAVYFAVGKRKQ
jgi:glucose uptake protein GlcU